MDNLLKRVLSLAVALVMVIGLMPWNAASVYATEETPVETPDENEMPEVSINETHASAHYAGADVEWKAWSGNREELYEGGYFCLTEDATLSGLVTTEHDPDRATSPVTGVGNLKVTICLHGHTLTGPNTRMFRLSGGADFTIVDCQGGGTLKPVKGNIQGKIAGFWSDDNGAPKAFNLYDVILDGSACSGTTVNGGVMSVGTKLTDGINIKGCTIKSFDALNGGVIYVNAEGNTFNIADTTITDCDAATDGGVFCTTRKQTLNMSGCTV
ncbi:MAG: hypothetical protein IJO45_05470, partial [Oscillospiraceae bacterium]|nr:hypothetical protein [Oscillospiraceae bacterium]